MTYLTLITFAESALTPYSASTSITVSNKVNYSHSKFFPALIIPLSPNSI